MTDQPESRSVERRCRHCGVVHPATTFSPEDCPGYEVERREGERRVGDDVAHRFVGDEILRDHNEGKPRWVTEERTGTDRRSPPSDASTDESAVAPFTSGLCNQCWAIYLNDLRAEGWMVAVHNDYRIDGERRTFWLLTKYEVAIKGEGPTDEDAFLEIEARLAELNVRIPIDRGSS